jgi:hydrogenase maturation protein HypF
MDITGSGVIEERAEQGAVVRVRGVVQGVGFRLFVLRLARRLGLAGVVRNDAAGGVTIEEVGTGAALERLMEALAAEAPPAAVVEALARTPAPELVGAHRSGFRIAESRGEGQALALGVGPDLATCAECRAEILDPRDRRHRYPFASCTGCGPRFSILEGVPYDRPMTTMAAFRMCPACLAEYEDPADRRFHAQPNACRACGPKARLERPRAAPW